jgi:hypothetical protein
MSGGWRDKLRGVLKRLFGPQTKAPQEPVTRAPSQPGPLDRPGAPPERRDPQPPLRASHELPIVAINFGIDFGTSFTKVCFRDVGTEESGVATFGERAGHLLPTVVAIDSSGTLFCADEAPTGSGITRIPYLKMRLAGASFGSPLPVIRGIDLNDQAAVRALSSWFLARVLQRSQQCMEKHERDRLKNRRPVWSANVGVPVEHCDSAAIEAFRQVLATAWLWVKRHQVPSTLDDLLSSYNRTLPELASEVADFHAVPEIAAAVQSFVMSREAEPGIYIYFDIGGGTIDGVAFDFINDNGARRINFYSGKVAPLGLSALAAALGKDMGGEIAADALEQILKAGNAASKKGFVDEIQLLVADVVWTAKQKDGRNWIRDARVRRGHERKYIGSLDPKNMEPLTVFIGGGGARAAWYRNAISSTYHDFNHKKAGIPPYKLIEVPKPGDLAMASLHRDEFRRFAISYGLSIPFGEGPDVSLPSQFAKAEPPPLWKPPGVVDYADSKDVYD